MLKLIALGLVLYYVVIPLLRFLMKGYVITQVHKKMSEQDIRSKQAASKSRKEGTIDVDFVPPKTKAKTDDVGGDYVPYEEIKE
ncbi:hypothetical protein [Aquirufa antheringensis]|uniref:hypothetical protein n=1 Tax=Pseudomonadati TaxID=3379134 RepID=UPI001F9C4E41|nr:hypothetical protein [Aquirufa antheringensis]MCE4217283.1 hypothetical protein [Pseudarcicella sp. GAP-15]MCZ2478520.1 hypothetical protein [Aquirufa antheringensis]